MTTSTPDRTSEKEKRERNADAWAERTIAKKGFERAAEEARNAHPWCQRDLCDAIERAELRGENSR